MRYQDAINIEDLRAIARRRLPRFVFTYVDGGAEDEVTLRGNREAFGRLRFRPRTLVDVSKRDLSTRLLGASLRAADRRRTDGPQRPFLARRRHRACARRLGGRRAIRHVHGLDEPRRGRRARSAGPAVAAGLRLLRAAHHRRDHRPRARCRLRMRGADERLSGRRQARARPADRTAAAPAIHAGDEVRHAHAPALARDGRDPPARASSMSSASSDRDATSIPSSATTCSIRRSAGTTSSVSATSGRGSCC